MTLTFEQELGNYLVAKDQEGKRIGTLFLNNHKGKWRVYSISSTHAESEHLRQIADKLDELNGVLK